MNMSPEAGGRTASNRPLTEVAMVFFRLGTTAFGGPAAHIAAMEDEIVTRRQWMSRESFVDLVGASNLIPGPNSTELAIHIGYVRNGWAGLLVAGLCFLLPAVAMVWALAYLYVRYGTRVEAAALLRGMQPVVLAVVLQAVWRMRTTLVRTRMTAALAVTACVMVWAGVSELHVLMGAVLVALGQALWPHGYHDRVKAWMPLALFMPSGAAAAVGPWTLLGSFAKIGSVLFGSGYVLLVFLRTEFVERLGVLSESQLLDAIAVGQVTPGPVFSAATFVGFLVAGHAGALAATVGIFLPAFIAVAATAPFVRRLTSWVIGRRMLDAVNAVSLALMLSVVLPMARNLAADWGLLTILFASTFLLLRTSLSAGWVLLLGALAGILLPR